MSETPKYRPVVWAEDGMTVWIPWSRERSTILCCTVLVAAGDSARVFNQSRDVDRWMRVNDLLVPPDDPHGRFPLVSLP